MWPALNGALALIVLMTSVTNKMAKALITLYNYCASRLCFICVSLSVLLTKTVCMPTQSKANPVAINYNLVLTCAEPEFCRAGEDRQMSEQECLLKFLCFEMTFTLSYIEENIEKT